jgi:hypothetical protein
MGNAAIEVLAPILAMALFGIVECDRVLQAGSLDNRAERLKHLRSRPVDRRRNPQPS